MKHCNIGGQAVLEGVMMKAPDAMAIAVRRSDGTISLVDAPVRSIKDKYSILKIPVLRGIITFGETLVLGVRSLMTSAELFGGDAAEEYTPSKLETFIAKRTGRSAEDIMIFFAVVLAVALALVLFVGVPTLAAGFLKGQVGHVLLNLIEGGIRLSVFLLYILLISRMKDIARVFQYHGAEHKTIHCYEHEEPLTVDNVRCHSTLHPRCGTSFLLIVMVISIFVFSLLGMQNFWLKIAGRILLLPLIAGISYEIIRFAGRSTSSLVAWLMTPGLMLQKLTTREPDDDQLEVAIEAFLAATGQKTKEPLNHGTGEDCKPFDRRSAPLEGGEPSSGLAGGGSAAL